MIVRLQVDVDVPAATITRLAEVLPYRPEVLLSIDSPDGSAAELLAGSYVGAGPGFYQPVDKLTVGLITHGSQQAGKAVSHG